MEGKGFYSKTQKIMNYSSQFSKMKKKPNRRVVDVSKKKLDSQQNKGNTINTDTLPFKWPLLALKTDNKFVDMSLTTYSLLLQLISKNIFAFELETSGGARNPT